MPSSPPLGIAGHTVVEVAAVEVTPVVVTTVEVCPVEVAAVEVTSSDDESSDVVVQGCNEDVLVELAEYHMNHNYLNNTHENRDNWRYEYNGKM